MPSTAAFRHVSYVASGAIACAVLPVVAAEVDFSQCVGIADASTRLACYDVAAGRKELPPGVIADAQPETLDTAPSASAKTSQDPVFRHDSGYQPKPKVSLLDSRWELDPDSKLGTFHLRAYRPVYVLPAFYATSLNRKPSSPSPDNQVADAIDIDRSELKFQLSFKAKLWENIFGDNGDLWTGYTQVSHWQVFNSATSRPFRETNYEPDLNLIFRTHYDVFGWKGRLLGIGVVHQSNGRGDPYSRSWNRVVGNLGLERDGWTLNLRPWYRIPESRRDDDNPDISDYIGRGEVQLIRVTNRHQISLLVRNSFRGDWHGAAQLDWAFPIKDELRGHVQLFHGYGESLIDYNHRAWYFGVGLSLLEWY